MKPSLIIHGGAWDIPDEAVDACKRGCLESLTEGWKILSNGGSALDAVEASIVVLQNAPVFDTGFGSHLNAEGKVECDAILMDSASPGGPFSNFPGRLGDWPTLVCGCYADVPAGGLSCTGLGEAIIKIVMAKTAVDFLRYPPRELATPKEAADHAAQESVLLLKERGRGTGGLILLDRDGAPAFAFNTPRMAYGFLSADGPLLTAL